MISIGPVELFNIPEAVSQEFPVFRGRRAAIVCRAGEPVEEADFVAELHHDDGAARRNLVRFEDLEDPVIPFFRSLQEEGMEVCDEISTLRHDLTMLSEPPGDPPVLILCQHRGARFDNGE